MNAFNADRDGVVHRAEEMGVNIIIDIGNDLESSCRAVKNSEDYQNVFATVGIHPHDAAKTDENELS